jgi:transcriptional regulator with XRE-family HTH domain
VSRPAIDPQRLKTRRTSVRLTRKALGSRVGISAKSVQQYEDGLRNPAPGVVFNIAQALGVSEEWLRGQVDTLEQSAPPPRPNLFSLVSSILALSPEDRAALLRLLQSEPHPAG